VIIGDWRYTMKCPRCDADIAGNRKCVKCGLDFAESQKDIEVEYKDFKTSELLEIRHKKRLPMTMKRQKAVREDKEEKTQKRESPGEALCNKDKKPLSFLVAIVLILVLIAGAFLIFRYFIMG
jgi:uncharacterized membrane protein YvbJ